MRILKTRFILISFLLGMIVIMPACKNKYAVEVAAIDSLVLKNKRAMDYLKIDLKTINTRRNEIKGQLAVLEKVRPDSSGVEFKMNLEKYKGIFKVYNKFIENYDVIFNRVRFNEKQLSTLKNSVMDEKISGYDFKLALNKERESVNNNLSNAETFGHRIFQLEPDYQRLSTYFDKEVNVLIKQFPELKAVLEVNSK